MVVRRGIRRGKPAARPLGTLCAGTTDPFPNGLGTKNSKKARQAQHGTGPARPALLRRRCIAQGSPSCAGLDHSARCFLAGVQCLLNGERFTQKGPRLLKLAPPWRERAATGGAQQPHNSANHHMDSGRKLAHVLPDVTFTRESKQTPVASGVLYRYMPCIARRASNNLSSYTSC